LVFRVKHVGNHTKGDGATRGTETAQETRSQDHGPFGTGASKDLPNVDSAQGQLHNPKATVFLRERRPKLASNAVQNQKPGHAGPGVGDVVIAKVVLLVNAVNSIAIYTRVVVWKASVILTQRHLGF
jgi:hypothetical protein